jgi:regulator of sigma E protease
MISILFAILGLSFLIFIHEYGHYYMARKVGMKVEAFAIGFGKPIFKWMKDGVEWRINILPFGGYVKIAGMQQEKGADLYQIKDGYFGKRPLDRIKVSFMGPMANFIFAFVAFTIIWLSGGQEKPLSEFNNRIGQVDQKSSLYNMGVRPGDIVLNYGNRDFKDFNDVIFSSLSSSKTIPITVDKVDYFTKEKQKRFYNLYSYQLLNSPFKTIGFLAPAGYLVYDGTFNENSPVIGSGIEVGDRIVWADGQLVFSQGQFHSIINQPSIFVTFVRDNKVMHASILSYKIKEFRLSYAEKAELDDWVHESKISKDIKNVNFIPYVITTDGVVQYSLALIDPVLNDKLSKPDTRNPYQINLQENDRIIAVNGKKVSSSYELIKEIQVRPSLIIVQKSDNSKPILWKNVNRDYNADLNFDNLSKIVSTIGTDNQIKVAGSLKLLKPITPLPLNQIHPEIDSRKMLDKIKQELFLGINVKDQKVIFNPNPFTLYLQALENIWKTLGGLFSGQVPAKYMSGPVGIVRAVSFSISTGLKDALYWLGFISLNLGIVNLLPIPMLDGGHIMFSGIEMVTRRKLKPKTIEKLIYPFVILIIMFFLYVTYHDILRVFIK